MGSKVYRYGGNGRSRSGAGRPAKKIGWGWFALPVLVALPVLWLLWPKGSEPPPEEPQLYIPKTVKEVKGVKVTPKAPAADESVPAKRLSSKSHGQQSGPHTNMYGYVINQPTSEVVITNAPSQLGKSIEEQIFSNTADQKIATLLTIQPGEMLVGDVTSLFGQGFVRQFKKALESPIEYDADDSPEVRELKDAVRQTREDLKRRLAAGEDIAQLMRDTYSDIQQLGIYREELSRQMAQFLRDRTLSQADAEDFVKAANELLAQRGAAPLRMPRFAVRRFELMNARTGKEKEKER